MAGGFPALGRYFIIAFLPQSLSLPIALQRQTIKSNNGTWYAIGFKYKAYAMVIRSKMMYQLQQEQSNK